MKQLLFVAITFLLASSIDLFAQETKNEDFVGYAGGRYEVYKTGDQESVELWFKWMELHVNEDIDGIMELAHEEIYIVAPEATISGETQLKDWLLDTFSNGDLTVEQRWAVPLKYLREDGSINPGNWIINDYLINYKTDDGVVKDDSEANIYIIDGKIRYIKIFTHKRETLDLKNVTFSVDLSNIDTPFQNVSVFGNFNSWCASCNYLNDDDGDGIYTGTYEVPVGELIYKFTLDQQSIEEKFDETFKCTKTTNEFTNRVTEIKQDTELSIVCFNSCTICE
jgi:hypothetical protein